MPNVLTTDNDDTGRALFGSSYDDTIIGGEGNDTIHAKNGDDTIIGSKGSDLLYGNDGNDLYIFGENFSEGGSYSTVMELANGGADTIWLTDGILAEDVYIWNASNGYLWLQHKDDPSDNTLRVYGTHSSGVSFTSHTEYIVFDDETVWDLTEGLFLRNNDTGRALFGSSYGDTIIGGAGNDTINAYGGNDTIIGSKGSDLLYGGAGDDLYIFGENFSEGGSYSTVMEMASGGADTIWLTDGILAEDVYIWNDSSGYLWLQHKDDPSDNTLRVNGAHSSGTTFTSHVEYIAFDDATTWDLTGGLHLRNNDTGRALYGSSSADVIEGGAGNDTLNGYGGNDLLIGGAGNDTLNGYAGDDILVGGAGNDRLNGGAGADTFVFLASDVGNGVDTIVDFSKGENDVIDLRDVLAGYDPLQDDIADFVQVTNSGNHSQVRVDLDGAGSGHGWVHIATVNNHTNVDLNDWISNGHLLAA